MADVAKKGNRDVVLLFDEIGSYNLETKHLVPLTQAGGSKL